MNKAWLVAKWEFLKFFKWKQEVIGYGLMLLIYLAIFAVQMWDAASDQDKIELAVAGELSVELDQRFSLHPVNTAGESEQFFQMLSDNQWDGVLKAEGEAQYKLFVAQSTGWQASLLEQLKQGHQQLLLTQLNLSQQQLDLIQDPIEVETINEAELQIGGGAKVLAMIASVLIAVGVFSSFGLCFASVTSEKMQRVTEQMLTCIAPQQWIDGKTLGVCLASIKSMFSAALAGGLIIIAVAVFSGEGTRLSIDIQPWIVAQMVLFFIPGILFWNYFYVGFAATIDDPNHSGKTGIMFLPAMPIFLVFMVMDDPGGQVATILSLFPLTSISFMPMRLASMEVPIHQFLMSFVVLVGSVYLMRLFATRVFAANITLFGKEPGWDQIWRAMLNSK